MGLVILQITIISGQSKRIKIKKEGLKEEEKENTNIK